MKLISYKPEHKEKVIKLYTRTFTASEGKIEGKSVGTLVGDLTTTTAKDDLYGFVALENEKIVGCIFFSRLTFNNDINAFMLSPVAVSTKNQGKGIGQQLINYGIEHLKEEGVQLLTTYGDPYYYIKVGFNPVSTQVLIPPFKLSMSEGWLAQSLTDSKIEAIEEQAVCVPAFNNEKLW